MPAQRAALQFQEIFMSEIEAHITPFRTIMSAMEKLRGDAPSLRAVQAAMEDALNVWVDGACASPERESIMRLAVVELNDAQLQSAIRGTGNPVYARIFSAIDSFDRVRLPNIRIRRLSNPDIDALIALGFDYDGARHHEPAAEWMVRGAAYGKRKFREKHPRKNPVVAYWEERGLSLPVEGLCSEGAKMVADLIRANDRLPQKVRASAERSARSTDWRVALCLRIEGHVLPYTINGVLNHIFGSSERHDAIKKLLAPATSNHEKLMRENRMAQMPTLEQILMLPYAKESLDPILEKLRCYSKEAA
jgi:hypothetical protein